MVNNVFDILRYSQPFSTAGLMAFLTNSEAINRIVQGDDYRAPVVRSLALAGCRSGRHQCLVP